jgi:tetratricopeptide (TPR) repeat protein
MGRYIEAIEYYEAALSATKDSAEERGKRLEENALCGLGKALMALGRYQEAAEQLLTAVEKAHAINDRRGESFNLANLGLAYRELGSLDQAETTYREGLAVALNIGERNVEGYCLGGLGKIHLMRRQFDIAIESLLNALNATRETNMKGGQQHWSTTLAQAYLHQGQLEAASEAINPVLNISVVWNNHRTWALYGLILARLGQADAASAAFLKAISYAAASLELTAGYYEAKYMQGLSLAGLAVLMYDPQRKAEYVSQAQEAYRAARDNCSVDGVVTSALYLFDELSMLGQAELLASIRLRIASES